MTLFYSLTSTDSAGGGRSAFTPRGISFTTYVQNPSTQHSLVNLVYKGIKASVGRHFDFSCARNSLYGYSHAPKRSFESENNMADSGKGGNEEHEMTNRKMSESGQPANNQNNHVQKSENSKKSLKKKGMKSAVLVKNLAKV